MSEAITDIESYLEDLDDEHEMIDYHSLDENQEDEEKGDQEGDNNNDEDADADADAEELKSVQMSDNDIDDDELEDGIIFMDDEGNYYYQSGKKAVPVKPVKPVKRKRSIKLEEKPKSTTPSQPKPKRTIQTTLPFASKEKTETSSSRPQRRCATIKRSSSPATPSSTKMNTRTKASPATRQATQVKTKTEKSPYYSESPNKHINKRSVYIKNEPESSPNKTIGRNSTSNSTVADNEEIYEFEETAPNLEDPEETDLFEEDPDDPNYVETEGVVRPLNSNNTKDYPCTMCDYKTGKKYLLARHLKTHSEARPYKCSVCERGFKTSMSLMNHINTHLGNKPFECADCDKSFTTSGELTRHRRYRHTGIKPHKCTECDYCSVELSKLKRHMRCHTGERPYQCPHCTYASPDTFKLKRHLRTHTGEKPYECDICHARFTQSNSLKYHRMIHSVNDKPVFQCSMCPTTCGRKTDLRLHIQKQHNTENPMPCKRCGKVLPDRYSYKMHVKTHEGEKCYRCKICSYASISQRHLDAHMLIHMDSKPFPCEICDSRFRQKQLLNRHMKIYHTENYTPPAPLQKEHQCPHCYRSFAFNGNLIRHMETHDPDSRISEEKQQLKMGRMKRVRPDGTVCVVFGSGDDEVIIEELNGDEIEMEEAELDMDNEEYDENVQYDFEEYDGDVDAVEGATPQITVKQEAVNENRVLAKTANSMLIKKEADANELMSVEVDDGYMVIEVMQDGEEETLMEAEAMPAGKVIARKSITTKTLADITDDCFGFDNDAEADEAEDTAAHELIQMLTEE